MKHSSVRNALLLLMFLLISASAYSQELYFCEGVDDDGYPKNESNVFTIPGEGGYLYFLVRLPYEFNSYTADFYVYKVDSYGNETYDSVISMETKLSWTFFWKQVTFYNDGMFKIYVYDDLDELIASGTVKVNYQD